MEEKEENSILNISNNSNNNLIINTNKKNNIQLEDEKENGRVSDINDDINFFKQFEEKNNIEKIVCPKCGEMPILELDCNNYIIKSYCPKRHNIEEKFISYIKQSNEKLEEEITCSECKKTNKQLKDDMYICNCRKIFCTKCKEEHKEKDDDDIEHNLIKYSNKDFICPCSEDCLDFNYFCVNCNKNLCFNCQIEHKDNNSDHNIIYYLDEVDKNLTEEQINNKKEEYEKQVKSIKEFLQEIDSWKEELEKKIEHLKSNLKMYLLINDYILNKFDSLSMNEQTIESLKRINLSYHHLISDFVKNKQFVYRVGYLVGLFNYQNNLKTNFFSKKKEKRAKVTKLDNLNTLRVIEEKADSKITAICQIQNGFAVGYKNGQIQCYNLNNLGNNLKKSIKISDSNGFEIKYLCTLKNNYFISSNENELKIIKLFETKDTILYNVINSFKYNEEINNKNNKSLFLQNDNLLQNSRNESFNSINSHYTNNNNLNNINNKKDNKYQIKELFNDNIIYIDGNNFIILEPTFNNNYIKKNSESIDSNIVYITEINKNKFSVYSSNNEIIIFDSETFERKEGFNINNNIKLIIIEGVNNDTLAGLGKEYIFLISIAKKQIIKIINIEKTNVDMLIINEPLKILVGSNYKNKGYIQQYGFNLTRDDVILSRNDIIELQTKIDLLYILQIDNNDKLICIHNNNIIRVFSK